MFIFGAAAPNGALNALDDRAEAAAAAAAEGGANAVAAALNVVGALFAPFSMPGPDAHGDADVEALEGAAPKGLLPVGAAAKVLEGMADLAPMLEKAEAAAVPKAGEDVAGVFEAKMFAVGAAVLLACAAANVAKMFEEGTDEAGTVETAVPNAVLI